MLSLEVRGYNFIIEERKLTVGYVIVCTTDKFQGPVAGGDAPLSITEAIEVAHEALTAAVKAAMLEQLGLPPEDGAVQKVPPKDLLNEDFDLE